MFRGECRVGKKEEIRGKSPERKGSYIRAAKHKNEHRRKKKKGLAGKSCYYWKWGEEIRLIEQGRNSVFFGRIVRLLNRKGEK